MDMYQFIKQIGQGSYGEVWLVKGSKTKKNYVLKRINFHPLHKREQKAAHLEAKLLCTVRHPNIITYVDSFYNSRGSLFIVMNCCKHGNLHDLIKLRNSIYFEEIEVIKFLVQICMALKYLHDQGILHRDLKTQSIFLTKNNTIKIGDFGIARIFNSIESSSPSVISSPCYIGPEVYSGKQFDTKSDIWSLGCCMYEMATLNYAFVTQDISSSLDIQSKLYLIPKHYSSQLLDILLSLLNIESEKRPSATELLLNDCIRRHILLFLRHSPQRSVSSQCCSYETQSTRGSTANTEVSSPRCPNAGLVENIPLNVKEMFKTTPDVNGNGDANDNSQQQASSSQNGSKSKKIPGASNNDSNAKDFATAKNLEVKKLFINGLQVTNVKQLEKRLYSYSQRLKSETSFRFLNTLTNSMNITRFKSLDSFSDNKLLYKGHFGYGFIPPRSAEDLSSISKVNNHYISKRPATSADLNFDASTDNTDGCCLPLIKEKSNNKHILNNKYSTLNLPLLPCCSHMHPKKDAQSKNDCLPNLEHSIVDKLLLRNIMECNKTKQDNTVGHKLEKIVKLNTEEKES